MKATSSLPLSFFCAVGMAGAGFYANVPEMWLEGRKAEVYEMAQRRLAADTNDVAGLCLKMEYEVAFLDFANVSNTMVRFLQQGGCRHFGAFCRPISVCPG